MTHICTVTAHEHKALIVQHHIMHHESTDCFPRSLHPIVSRLPVWPACNWRAPLLGEVGVMGACCAGSIGKTTTAWLIRGIFEEWGKLTGMAGTIENAIYADKLDAEGALWTPDEPDPTLDRRALLESSITPSWLIAV